MWSKRTTNPSLNQCHNYQIYRGKSATRPPVLEGRSVASLESITPSSKSVGLRLDFKNARKRSVPHLLKDQENARKRSVGVLSGTRPCTSIRPSIKRPSFSQQPCVSASTLPYILLFRTGSNSLFSCVFVLNLKNGGVESVTGSDSSSGEGVIFDPQQVVGPCVLATDGANEPTRHLRDTRGTPAKRPGSEVSVVVPMIKVPASG